MNYTHCLKGPELQLQILLIYSGKKNDTVVKFGHTYECVYKF